MTGTPILLPWGAWCEGYSYRSWDSSLNLREAKTPFGTYHLTLRYDWGARGRILDVGKWFVACPCGPTLGPFNDDVAAARAAQEDFDRRVRACLKPVDKRAERV